MSVDSSHPAAGVTVRFEEADDVPAIRRLSEAAFGGRLEAGIVDALRNVGAITLSMVAAIGGEVIGHALFTPVTLITNGPSLPLLGLGPVAVLPEYQGRGVGTLLIEACLEQLRQSGAAGVVVVGDPAYYARFGFIPAARWGLRAEMEVPEGAFMALEFSPGKLAGASGIIRYRPEFTQAARLK